MSNAFKRLKHRVWMQAGHWPAALPLLRRYCRSTGRVLHIVTEQTEVLIEGFPRSANTRMVAAFHLAQDRPVVSAHHVHGCGQVIAAVRLDIPVILLLRDPVDAVTSLLIRYPFLDAREALRSYVAFHRPLLPLLGAVVVAPFDDVVEDPDTVIERLNNRFNRSFGLLRQRGIATSQVQHAVEAMDKDERDAEAVSELTVARPSQQREKIKRDVRTRVCAPNLQPEVELCQDIHRRVLESAGS